MILNKDFKSLLVKTISDLKEDITRWMNSIQDLERKVSNIEEKKISQVDEKFTNMNEKFNKLEGKTSKKIEI